jgi:molecular chaperone GrpE (heat shock protein)
MTECVTSKLPKWPFLLADLILLGFAGFIVYNSQAPLSLWQAVFCLVAIGLGAWLSVIPFLKEYRSGVQLAQSYTLANAMGEFQKMEVIQTQIANATSQWQTVQDHSTQTVNAAKGIADRMKTETQEFMAFLAKANETEKAHLRLEVEKLRRAEAEWLQVTVRILDHIFALNQAAARSGQPGLISQLGQFQHACRDAARRMGLVPFTAAKGDVFEAKIHQIVESQGAVPENGRIGETLATGYTYQGQLIRRAVIRIGPEAQPELNLLPQSKDPLEGRPNVAEPTEAAPPKVDSENVAAAV